MTSSLFTINWADIKSALISAVLMAVLAIAIYIIGVGDLWQIDSRALINIGTMAFLTGIVSLVKHFLTDNSGEFAGITNIVK